MRQQVWRTYDSYLQSEGRLIQFQHLPHAKEFESFDPLLCPNIRSHQPHVAGFATHEFE